jgi:hypothetical protein
MPSIVASETIAHAMNPPAPHALRQLAASDRAPASPFESLLDDGTQAAAQPCPERAARRPSAPSMQRRQTPISLARPKKRQRLKRRS